MGSWLGSRWLLPKPQITNGDLSNLDSPFYAHAAAQIIKAYQTEALMRLGAPVADLARDFFQPAAAHQRNP
jgi:hypothetical protein